MINPWEVLGVHRQSTDEEVHTAYIALARKHHPDKKKGDHDKFVVINEANRLLKMKNIVDVFIHQYRSKVCGTCSGKGATSKSRGFHQKVYTACKSCGGAGLIINEKEKKHEGTTIIHGTASTGGKGRNNKRRS